MATETQPAAPCPVCGQASARVVDDEGYERWDAVWEPPWSDRAFCSRECARTEMLVSAIENILEE